MDFDKFENRNAAERGHRVRLKDPITQAPLGTDDDHPAVVIRGSASRVYQALLREKQKADLLSEKEDEDDKVRVLEDTHAMFMDMAIPYIIRLEGVTFTDPVTGATVSPTSSEHFRAFLDLTFPVFGAEKQEDDSIALRMTNKPFANQIIEASNELEKASGNAESSSS